MLDLEKEIAYAVQDQKDTLAEYQAGHGRQAWGRYIKALVVLQGLQRKQRILWGYNHG